MLTLKLKYFVHYYKSKILKKKCKKNYKDQKIQFEDDIKEKSFSNKWFLNNFDIFSFFLPQDKNSKFVYLEVGCFEGLSSFFVLSEYKAVDATLLDIWDMPNPNSKTLSHNFNSIEDTFDNITSAYHAGINNFIYISSNDKKEYDINIKTMNSFAELASSI